jgi:hypothetical protein
MPLAIMDDDIARSDFPLAEYAEFGQHGFDGSIEVDTVFGISTSMEPDSFKSLPVSSVNGVLPCLMPEKSDFSSKKHEFHPAYFRTTSTLLELLRLRPPMRA